MGKKEDKERTFGPGEHSKFWTCDGAGCGSKITIDHELLVRGMTRYVIKRSGKHSSCAPKNFLNGAPRGGKWSGANPKKWTIFQPGKHPHFNRRRRLTGIE